MTKRSTISARRLYQALAEQEKAANIASTATGFIMSLCFFVLPLVWSNVFKILPLPAPPPTTLHDPWSQLNDL